ncbi:oxidoreductase HTATIP2 [Elysia marginata]|uniref:Oxidoreductase HTATIP2 n=1 Tax=Elysia marginata TaxID=1093978 RepID=A0AAV4JDW4_9GAST|nr:oxidoreductase HTATIP2 [Elysia marginata]
MKFLWFRCDVIIPSSALAVFVLILALVGFLVQLELQLIPDSELHCSMASEAAANLNRFRSENHSAFIVGYTGEIGKALVHDLNELKIFKKVVLIGRRQVILDVGPEFEQKVINFDRLDEHRELFRNLDVGFCCLSTTQEKSGTQGFIKVDHDYTVLSAEIAKQQGCKQFSIVSSRGADKKSTLLYPRTKGQVEEALKLMKFQRLSIYRPGMLLSKREEKHLLEVLTGFVLKHVHNFFPTAISTPVDVVVRAMINHVLVPLPGTPQWTLYNNKALHLASGLSRGCPTRNVEL